MRPMQQSRPLMDGMFMPAEWERHAACWMAWPCRESLWGDRLLHAQVAYARVAKAIQQFEPVRIIARPKDVAEARFACGRSVEVVPLEIDDSWLRDTGPTFLIDGQGRVAGVHWQFNGWGDRHRPYDKDARVGAALLEHLGMRCYEAPLVLEGGAISVDGYGSLLATEQCLLNPNRNPLLSRSDIEEDFALFLGVRRIIWLGEGFEDDETDGHVDNVACFAGPGRVLLNVCEDPADPNYRIMQDNLARLQAARDARGEKIEVIPLPQPERRLGADGRRLPLSYVNSYIANGGVVAPAFDDPADGRAAEVLQAAFPGRRVVQVPVADIVCGGGGIHCITQQQPAGSPLR